MRWLRLNLCASAVFCVFVLACGSESLAPLPFEELEQAVEKAYCERLVRCGSIESLAECHLDLGDEYGPDVAAAVGNGTITYDGEKAQECVHALARMSCEFFSNEPVPACGEMLLGAVEEEAACFVHAQCVSGRCETTDCGEACCEGACSSAIPEAAIGESCADARCVGNAFCDQGRICVEKLPVGSTCRFGQCRLGLFCDENGTRTCIVPPGRDEACNPTQPCAREGLVCDRASETCQPMLFEGDQCDAASDRCSPLYLRCDPAMGTCTRFPEADEPCDEYRCIDGAFCDITAESPDGMCRAKRAAGEPCEYRTQCASDACSDSGVCLDGPQTCVQ